MDIHVQEIQKAFAMEAEKRAGTSLGQTFQQYKNDADVKKKKEEGRRFHQDHQDYQDYQDYQDCQDYSDLSLDSLKLKLDDSVGDHIGCQPLHRKESTRAYQSWDHQSQHLAKRGSQKLRTIENTRFEA